MSNSKQSTYYNLVCLIIVLVANTFMLICFGLNWHWWEVHTNLYFVLSGLYLLMLAVYINARDNEGDFRDRLFYPIHVRLEVWQNYIESSKCFGYLYTSNYFWWGPENGDRLEIGMNWYRVQLSSTYVGRDIDFNVVKNYTLKIFNEEYGIIFFEDEGRHYYSILSSFDEKLIREGYKVLSCENEYGFVKWRYKDCAPKLQRVRKMITGIISIVWYFGNVIVIFTPIVCPLLTLRNL